VVGGSRCPVAAPCHVFSVEEARRGRPSPNVVVVSGSSFRAAPLADRIVADALDPEVGAAGANVALRVLDAVGFAELRATLLQ
jgi:hypothetical protein